MSVGIEAGSTEQWCRVSRFSHLMVVKLKVAGSAEQWCIVFEVFSFNGSIS